MWQPIENAPKDGRRLLLTPGDAEPITVGWYETASWDKGWKSLEAESWGGCECCGSGCAPININPAHWMHLPEPPK